MADAAPPLKPKWQLILGLLPSMNSCIIAVVTAAVTLGGTLAAQKLNAPKSAMVIPGADTKLCVVPGKFADQVTKIEGDVGLIADWVAAQKPKIPGRPIAVKK